MRQSAAKQGDKITAVDTHITLTQGMATPLLYPFTGIINDNLSNNVNVMGKPAATVGSTAENTPPHIPQGGTFQKTPTNKGQITAGSATVMINGKPAARNGDRALTCDDDPVAMPKGTVVAASTVMIG